MSIRPGDWFVDGHGVVQKGIRHNRVLWSLFASSKWQEGNPFPSSKTDHKKLWEHSSFLHNGNKKDHGRMVETHGGKKKWGEREGGTGRLTREFRFFSNSFFDGFWLQSNDTVGNTPIPCLWLFYHTFSFVQNRFVSLSQYWMGCMKNTIFLEGSYRLMEVGRKGGREGRRERDGMGWDGPVDRWVSFFFEFVSCRFLTRIIWYRRQIPDFHHTMHCVPISGCDVLPGVQFLS